MKVFRVVFCLFVLVATSLLARASGGFVLPLNYPTGIVPYSSAIADFNGDGNLDIAVAGVSGSYVAVSILINNSDGSFQSPLVHVATSCNGAIYGLVIATADFNRDGHADLAVTNKFGNTFNEHSTICVLLGNGDGTFMPGASYDSGGEFASFMVVGDYNRDGIPDLIVTNQDDGVVENGTLAILLGVGDGTFSSPISVLVGFFDDWVTVADFNHDRQLDAAIIDNGSLQVLLSFGTSGYPTTDESPWAVVSADLNLDGIPDLVVITEFALVDVLLGRGDGTFQPPLSFPGEWGMVSIGDLNHDGIPDVVVVGGNVIGILLGNGDGTLQHQMLYDVGNATWASLGDFNGDGRLDIAVSTSSSTEAILRGNGDGTVQAPVAQAAQTGPLAVGDFNHDGNLDVVTIDQFDALALVFLGDGAGNLVPAKTFPLDVASYPDTVAVADFDGDGNLDVTVGNYGTRTVSVLLGNGDGTLRNPMDYGIAGYGIYVSAGDLNGDGFPDIVAATATPPSISVLLNAGHGVFLNPTTYGSVGGPVSVVIADLNRDGRNDLAFADYFNRYEGKVGVMLGVGDGTFGPVSPYPALTTYNSAIQSGDLNNDGIPDLVVGDSYGFSVLQGNGNDGFIAHTFSGALGNNISLADFNGDGHLDIIGAGSGLNIAINNNVQFNPVSYPAGGYSVAAGDFNNDGAPDVALNLTSGVTVLLNTGGTIVNLRSSTNPSNFMQTVDFQAQVRASVKGSPGGPTGKVTFCDNGLFLAVAPLVNGQVSYRTSSLAAGNHSITATYSGDATYNRHVSAPLLQVVNP